MLILLTLLGSAHAGPSKADQAEAVRLANEVDRLAQKLAWGGVERSYERLVALKEIVAPSRTHLVAAQAAMERGDVRTAWDRAQRAAASADTPESLEAASNWMADFFVNYGEVAIEVSVSWKGPLQLELRDASFTPSHRVVIAYAQAQLDASREYKGYLPMGRYTLAGTDFEVIGGPRERVFVKPPKSGPVAPPTTGPTPEPEPPPVDAPPDRIVTLAVRGGGWPADGWAGLSSAVRDRLYGVEGVLAVDVFEPDDPWVVVDLVPDELAAHGLAAADVARILERTLIVPGVAMNGDRLALPPGSVSAAEVGAAAVVGGAKPVLLKDVAKIAPGEPGGVPVPADDAQIARWRLEVRVSGKVEGVLDKLLVAANAADGAAPLQLTLEGPGAR